MSTPSSPPTAPDHDTLASDILSDETLFSLRQRLMQTILALADGLDAAIEDAPLNQRASALSTLIDKLIKLDGWLPQSAKSSHEENRFIIAYEHEDGSINSAPPWAKDNPEWGLPFRSRRMREKMGEDGTR